MALGRPRTVRRVFGRCLFQPRASVSASLRGDRISGPANQRLGPCHSENGECVAQTWGSYPSGLIKNCIIWANSSLFGRLDHTVNISYSDIEGSGGSDAWVIDPPAVDDGGNIDADPLFVGGPSGTWTQDGVYVSGPDRTRLTHMGADFTVDVLKGRFLNPNTAGKNWFYIASNTVSDIYVVGDASAVGSSNLNYKVHDLHLQSRSPCIDAGDPDDDYAMEPTPDGGRINMGIYGNTAQASSTPPAGTLIMVR